MIIRAGECVSEFSSGKILRVSAQDDSPLENLLDCLLFTIVSVNLLSYSHVIQTCKIWHPPLIIFLAAFDGIDGTLILSLPVIQALAIHFSNHGVPNKDLRLGRFFTESDESDERNAK